MRSFSKPVICFIGLAALHIFAAQVNAQEASPQDAPGPLSLAHSEKPGLKDCSVCHTPEYEVKPDKCLACHQEMAQRMTEGRGFHKEKKQNCGTCHAEHQGENVSLIPLDLKTFNHAQTGFVLKGVHETLNDCAPCHAGPNSFSRNKTKSFLLKDSRCTGCHVSPHQGHQEDCLSCHSFEDWWVGNPVQKGGR
jgi:hypothetical protein